MLVLIGGGDLKSRTTKEIDEFIVDKSNKQRPDVLFIPTAMKDSQKAIDNFYKSYGEMANIKVLKLYSQPEIQTVKDMIHSADIIYVSGGNTKCMLEKWSEYNLGELIFNYKDTKVIAGISAGAICWFDYYLGDDESFYDNGYCNFRVKKGLEFIEGVCCPHYDEDGKDIFNSIMRNMSCYGYALENNTALVYDLDKRYVVKSKKSSSVYEFEPFNKIMRELK